MLEWEPLTLQDRPRVNDCLRRFPPSISEHTFTNLFVWRECRQPLLAEVDGTLLFACECDGRRSLLGPSRGTRPLAELLEPLVGSGVEGFERIPGRTAERLRELGLTVEADRDNSDYVYRRTDLAGLPGRRYHRQKNFVNRCLSRYDCAYCEITFDVLDEVAEMQDRWCARRNCGKDAELCAEYRAIRQMLGHYGELGLLGGTVRVGGRVEAYTVGEALNPNTVVVHFEKAATEFTGLYQLINRWFCENTLREFEFVNREQDLGIPGLRKAKESYHPDHMVDKYAAAWPEQPLTVAQAAAGRCVG